MHHIHWCVICVLWTYTTHKYTYYASYAYTDIQRNRWPHVDKQSTFEILEYWHNCSCCGCWWWCRRRRIQTVAMMRNSANTHDSPHDIQHQRFNIGGCQTAIVVAWKEENEINIKLYHIIGCLLRAYLRRLCILFMSAIHFTDLSLHIVYHRVIHTFYI